MIHLYRYSQYDKKSNTFTAYECALGLLNNMFNLPFINYEYNKSSALRK